MAKLKNPLLTGSQERVLKFQAHRCWMVSWCARPKVHGTGRRIEGFQQADAPVIIVDDVCTTGASTVTAIEAAREAGMRVIGVICLVEREDAKGRPGGRSRRARRAVLSPLQRQRHTRGTRKPLRLVGMKIWSRAYGARIISGLSSQPFRAGLTFGDGPPGLEERPAGLAESVS